MAKKNALAKRGPAALANWEQELAKDAADVASKEQVPTGSFISLKGGMMSIDGSPVKENKLQVVIIDHCYENSYYESDYDANSPAPPVCYAFGREEKELKPHEKSSAPQHDQCAGCAHNVFGSAEKGKGKACKNVRRLAMLSADGLSPDAVKDGAVRMLKLPVTSTKAWAAYVQGLNAVYKRPPYAVITEMEAVPDPKTQVKVTFKFVDHLPATLGPSLLTRRKEVQEGIMFPYGDPKPPEEKPKKGKKGAAVKGKKQKF